MLVAEHGSFAQQFNVMALKRWRCGNKRVRSGWSRPEVTGSFRAGHSSFGLLHRQRRAFGECLELRPGNLRMSAAAETAVGAGVDILHAVAPGETPDALRHQL